MDPGGRSGTDLKPIGSGGRDQGIGHVAHLGMAGALLTPQAQFGQSLDGPFSFHFHRAVDHVAHPAAKAKIGCASEAAGPVAHTLHFASHCQAPALAGGGRARFRGNEKPAAVVLGPAGPVKAARRHGIAGHPPQWM